MRVIDLDVSALEPPEPLERILAVLPDLGGGRWLRVRHRREPHPLYGLLAEAGYRWQTRRDGEGWEIRVWREGDGMAESDARAS